MSEPIKIRVPVKSLVINVNDEGGTVTLPVGDERFRRDLLEFAESVQKEGDELSKNSPSVDDSKAVLDFAIKNVEFHESLHNKFNTLFGDNAYEKVFGEDIVVGADYVIDFIMQCLPFINENQKMRMDRLNKYNANRVGSTL